jgi:hypothetical protein
MKTIFKLFTVFSLIFFISCDNEAIIDESQGLTNNQRTKRNEDKGCETAYAFYENGCFLNDDFNRWGWVIGPLKTEIFEYKQETFKIFAAAGQCSPEKGTFIGALHVEGINGILYIDYQIDQNSEYLFTQTHLYVGSAKYPALPNGNPTVAPGKYNYQHDLGDGASEDLYVIELKDFSEDFYIIAHAVVCPK